MRADHRNEPADGAERARAGDLAHALVEALSSAGWKVRSRVEMRDDRRLDLIASRRGARLAIEMKSISEGRPDRLIPLWSQAWLQAQHAAPPGHIPMAVVAAQRIPPKAAEAVLDFVATVAPEASAGVMDMAGMRRFVGPHSQGLDAAPDPSYGGKFRPLKARGRLFSDLNQWMLKVLLAPGIPEHMLRAPRGQYLGASDLAEAAEVSIMSASRLLQDLRHEGHLDTEAPSIRLVRVAELLERWKAAAAARPVVQASWRSVLRGHPDEVLDRWLKQAEGCVALFAAAGAHGVGFVKGVPPHVYERNGSPAQRPGWRGFVPAEAGAPPDLIVRRADAPKSVFRGMVSVRGRPVSDVLQVWLDVASEPARGAEQADLIWRKVLKPLVRAS